MPNSPTMYELLGQHPNDIVAALAYQAYAKHEHDFINGIHSTTGAPPTQEDLDVFYRTCSAPAMLQMYQQQAKILVNAFVQESLEGRKAVLEREFVFSRIGQQLAALHRKLNAKRSWRGWLADVSGNLLVNFATILIIAALLFGFRGLEQLLRRLGRDSGVLLAPGLPAQTLKLNQNGSCR